METLDKKDRRASRNTLTSCSSMGSLDPNELARCSRVRTLTHSYSIAWVEASCFNALSSYLHMARAVGCGSIAAQQQ